MIPVCEPLLDGNERKYVNMALDANWIAAGGEFSELFEAEFAHYCGCKYGVSCTSGTTALHLALAALNVRAGDEVIVPDLTIAACAFAVSYLGARPVLVDVMPDTLTLDPARVEAAVTPRTVAIMPVHLYGRPCEMDEIMDIAQRHNLAVVEDAAEAHGARYKGRTVGGIGTEGCFSFYANKLLTTGEGGMLVTNDRALAQRARRLKDLNHTPGQRFFHQAIGYNYRMTNVQAAIGLAQLETLEHHIEMRQRHAEMYAELLAGVPGVTLSREGRCYVESVVWMQCALAVDANYRVRLMQRLAARNIGVRPYFIPLHHQPMYTCFDGDARFPVATDAGKRGFYLPSGTGLTRAEIMQVCNCVKECAAQCV